jgi:hypothetical protein
MLYEFRCRCTLYSLDSELAGSEHSTAGEPVMIMPTHRAGVVSAVLLLPLLMACGREERTLNVQGSFEAAREVGGDVVLELEGRLPDNQLPTPDFNAMWDVVTRGSQAASGIAVTLHGGTPRDDTGLATLAGMILVLPAPLTAGATYPIERALAVPSQAMPMYWGHWGPVQLLSPGKADIGLRVFEYQASGMAVQNDFVAVQASGTVQVLRRRGQQVEMRLDVMASDTAGRAATIRGNFTLTPERYTPPIS